MRNARFGLVLGAALVAAACGLAVTPTGDPRAAACDAGALPGTQIVAVVQEQMRPTLIASDAVAVLPIAGADLLRGDVIAFGWTAWNSDGPPTVMRVIGLPGDQVELRSGDVYVNGAKPTEPYLLTQDVTQPELVVSSQMKPSAWSVATGTVLVLGDNRAVAADSRAYGTLPTSAVIGRVVYRCEPSGRRGPIG